MNTGLIDPYIFKWGEQPLRHDRSKYDAPRIPKRVVSANRRKLYQSPKIIYAKLAKRPEAALDSAGQYAALNVNCFHSPRADISLELILAFSNSSIFRFLYEQLFGALRMGPSYQFQAPQLRTIPFIVPNNSIRTEIERTVQMMLDSQGELSTLMESIDYLFYQSYGLDDREVGELEESIESRARSV